MLRTIAFPQSYLIERWVLHGHLVSLWQVEPLMFIYTWRGHHWSSPIAWSPEEEF